MQTCNAWHYCIWSSIIVISLSSTFICIKFMHFPIYLEDFKHSFEMTKKIAQWYHWKLHIGITAKSMFIISSNKHGENSQGLLSLDTPTTRSMVHSSPEISQSGNMFVRVFMQYNLKDYLCKLHWWKFSILYWYVLTITVRSSHPNVVIFMHLQRVS